MTAGWGGAGALYLLAGGLVAWLLYRAGHPRGAAAVALVAWPLLVGLVAQPRSGRGPLAPRIGQAFRGVEEALAATSTGEWRADLEQLRLAVEAADGRLAVVDRILASGEDPDLRRARDRAAAELASVLTQVDRLRVEAGLLALSELRAADSVERRLAHLLSRVRAMDDLAALES